jgi:hypothetical protein
MIQSLPKTVSLGLNSHVANPADSMHVQPIMSLVARLGCGDGGNVGRRSRRGYCAALKYLEMIEPYPAAAREETILWPRRRFPVRACRKTPTLHNPVTKVYKVEPGAEGDTVK